MDMGSEGLYDVSTYITSELASSLDHTGYGASVGGVVFHPVSLLKSRRSFFNKYPTTSRGFPGVLSNGRWFESDPGSATV